MVLWSSCLPIMRLRRSIHMKDPTLIRQLLGKYGLESFPTSCWIDSHVELLQFASLSLKWGCTRDTNPMIVGMSVYTHTTDIILLIFLLSHTYIIYYIKWMQIELLLSYIDLNIYVNIYSLKNNLIIPYNYFYLLICSLMIISTLIYR